MTRTPKTHHIVPSPITATTFVGSATAVTRTQLVWQHIYAAARNSRMTGELEAAHKGQALGNFINDIFAHASGSIVQSAAGMEAYANQIFADRAKIFPAFDQILLDSMWDSWAERLSPIEKFQMAFQVKGLPSLDTSKSPVQDVRALFQLRNGLVHFKPEWSHERVEQAKLEKKLASSLSRSPFFPINEPLFPMAWATHDNTKWAVEKSIALIAHVTTALGMDGKVVGQLKSFAT